MNPAILIPTYIGHINFNLRFLESIQKHCPTGQIPEIYFATSNTSELSELMGIVSTLEPKLNRKVKVFSLDVALFKLDEFTKHHNDVDGNLLFRAGRLGLINFKKLEALKWVFKNGHSHVAVLDSESAQFRDGSLLECIEFNSSIQDYRYSKIAYNHELMTKIQHDSIRSVVESYNSNDIYCRSYGWFDNMCIYEKSDFNEFMEYMSHESDGDTLSVCSRLRGLAFEWIAYKAHQILVRKKLQNMIDLDEIIGNFSFLPKISFPLTENIYNYMTGDIDSDAALLAAINPPWVPASGDGAILAAIDKALPTRCCLMFHFDRQVAKRSSAIAAAPRGLKGRLRRLLRISR